jgi:hypothetical protein
LSPGSIDSPIVLVNAFFQKYFPANAQHAALQIFFDFEQVKAMFKKSVIVNCSVGLSLGINQKSSY